MTISKREITVGYRKFQLLVIANPFQLPQWCPHAMPSWYRHYLHRLYPNLGLNQASPGSWEWMWGKLRHLMLKQKKDCFAIAEFSTIMYNRFTNIYQDFIHAQSTFHLVLWDNMLVLHCLMQCIGYIASSMWHIRSTINMNQGKHNIQSQLLLTKNNCNI